MSSPWPSTTSRNLSRSIATDWAYRPEESSAPNSQEPQQKRGAVCFFDLTGGLILALYPRSELAKDSKVSNMPASSLEFSIGYLAESRDDVDRLIEQARAAGATLTEAPHERPWGIYSGYFKDLDGHLWEIIWNPPRVA